MADQISPHPERSRRTHDAAPRSLLIFAASKCGRLANMRRRRCDGERAMSGETTVLREADWVVAWDEAEQSHVYLEQADLAFRDGEMIFVGKNYAGPASRKIAGAGRMVVPGFVNVHSHPTSEPGNKGVLEELGSTRLGQSSLYEFMPVFRIAPEAATAATQVAVSELLKSGVTTLLDLSGAPPGWPHDLPPPALPPLPPPLYRSASLSTRDAPPVRLP